MIGAGKVWLAPMMTPAHFHSLVYASVLFHNIFAIPFIIAAVILMVKWSKNQLPESCDGKWFLALGGYINLGGKAKHPDAGFANAGEKASSGLHNFRSCAGGNRFAPFVPRNLRSAL